MKYNIRIVLYVYILTAVFSLNSIVPVYAIEASFEVRYLFKKRKKIDWYDASEKTQRKFLEELKIERERERRHELKKEKNKLKRDIERQRSRLQKKIYFERKALEREKRKAIKEREREIKSIELEHDMAVMSRQLKKTKSR